MACDTIIAHPQTTTGSIGVIMAVPNINKGIDKLGVTYDTISTGHGNPFFLDPFLPISEKDKTTLQNYAYKTYNSFVTKAAKSRNKSFDEMRALAKGRVWTGNDAYRHGLIDLVGGLETAINLAKTRVDIADSMEVRLRFFPEESKKWEYLMKKFIKGNFIHSLLARHGKHMEIEAVSELLALPEPIKNQFLYTLQLNRIASQEKVILSLPYSIEVK